MRPMDESQQHVLEERFAGSGEDVDQLVTAISLASLRTDMHRHAHEMDNVGARLQLRDAQLQQYREMAGNPDQIAPYIRWFGRTALAAFQTKGRQFDFNSISLELGGWRQDGDWECIRPLDDMVRPLPGLFADDQEFRLEEISKSHSMKNYLLLPMREFTTDEGGFPYAVVRRRRGVANMYFGDHHYYIFKQSIGLVVLGQMMDDEKRQVVRLWDELWNSAPAKYEDRYATNTPPANLAGRVFERAIAEPDRSHVRDVVPISAQYVMKMRDPFTQPKNDKQS